MKKILTISAIALFGAVLLPSCKKDYTCVCTTSIPGANNTSTEVELGKLSKKDAEAACNGKASVGGQTYMTCELK